ncbi:anti-sigma B factor antagonist [Micromonospora rhizosphaerae]|uniref:Anti-sigma factor antagonist n=1 Tax=Micromonospora rhizosphaerae TaxID=568872 RepID=A0A1C6ST44_9ACTN|nr:STAS domain-containing protein [Micromonospora rhizosphaerae]SCL32766.1 anti-sigma B factor antagonist [Micromonospora rhizosphaerae]
MNAGIGQTWRSKTTVRNRTAVVTLFGELDIAGAGELRDVLHAAIARATQVQVDMARVTFIDSTVLTTFVNAHHRAADASVSFAVVNPAGHVRRVLTMTGILSLLTSPEDDD